MSAIAPRMVRALFTFGMPAKDWSLTLIGLCTFTFAVVSYRLPVSEVGIGIAALGMLLRVPEWRFPRPLVLYAGFVAWCFLASLASPYPQIAVEHVVDDAKLLVIMVIVVNALRTPAQVRFYVLFFLACFILFPVRGTLVGGDQIMGRAVWNYIYSNPNDLASLCLITLGVAAGAMAACEGHRMARTAAAAACMLLVVVILLTQSRGAFIGLVAGMGPALASTGIRRPARLALVLTVLSIVVATAVPPAVWERLSGIGQLTDVSTIADDDAEGSAEERFEIQKTGWEIFVDHAVFGIGLGAYPEANEAYAPQLGRKDTHNTYLNLAAETGLPGAILWAWLVASTLMRARRARLSAPPSALATQQAWIERSFVAFLVAAIFGSYAKLNFPYMFLAVLWCSAQALTAAHAEEPPA